MLGFLAGLLGMQFKPDWFLYGWASFYVWVLTIAAWLGSRRCRQAFWAWLTDEHLYRNFGFVLLLWPQRERKRVWPRVMEDLKIAHLERLEKARQYRGDQLPKWWVALANIRFLLHMAFLVFEMSRVLLVATVQLTAKKHPHMIKSHLISTPTVVNAACHIEVRAESTTTGAVKVRLVEPPEQNGTDPTQG